MVSVVWSAIGSLLEVPSRRWDALLDASSKSGQSAMAFCNKNCLKYPTFPTRLQKHRSSLVRTAPGPVHTVENSWNLMLQCSDFI